MEEQEKKEFADWLVILVSSNRISHSQTHFLAEQNKSCLIGNLFSKGARRRPRALVALLHGDFAQAAVVHARK